VSDECCQEALVPEVGDQIQVMGIKVDRATRSGGTPRNDLDLTDPEPSVKLHSPWSMNASTGAAAQNHDERAKPYDS
jgi:hypothetical protein